MFTFHDIFLLNVLRIFEEIPICFNLPSWVWEGWMNVALRDYLHGSICADYLDKKEFVSVTCPIQFPILEMVRQYFKSHI